MRVQTKDRPRGPYNSTRLKNIETEWNDLEFLQFVKHQHELRTRKPEIIKAFQTRVDAISLKLAELQLWHSLSKEDKIKFIEENEK